MEDLQQRLKVVKHGLSEEERHLTVQNYVDFLVPSTESDSEIYLPFHTVTASELKGMS